MIGATKTRLDLEALDRRDMPSVSVVDGVINITGTDRADVVAVRIDDRGTASPYDDRIAISEYNGIGRVAVTNLALWKTSPFAASGFVPVSYSKVTFWGGAGDDTFENHTAIETQAYGQGGNDTLRGGSSSDELFGMSGDDILYGNAGSDMLCGNEGNDEYHGGSENDLLTDAYPWTTTASAINAESGDDTMDGDGGRDTLYGYSGNDYLAGGKDGAKDTLVGGTGADTFKSEWVTTWAGSFWLVSNRDDPADFNTAEGDKMV